MRRLVIFGEIGLLVILSGCSTSKMADKFPVTKINQDLCHWISIGSDSVLIREKGVIDSRIKDYNLKRLRNNLDKDKDSPYWGESIYYMLQDLFKK